MRNFAAIMAVTFLFPQILSARPLLTEEPETLGRYTFEAGVSLSQRDDAFNSPKITYKTVNFPVLLRLGLHKNLDIGFNISYINQRLETGGANFSGSRTGLFSPLIKISPWKNFSFLTLWHTKATDEAEQDLPIARGDDLEAILSLRLADIWPTTVNIGYVSKGKYHSKLGVATGIPYKIEPGDIFEAKSAVEIPLKWHLSLLTELAYYNFQSKKISDQAVTNSAGEALDALVGLTWNLGGWNIGLGTAFGLLDESHTSFDLERGAGDVLYKLTACYKLSSRKPGR